MLICSTLLAALVGAVLGYLFGELMCWLFGQNLEFAQKYYMDTFARIKFLSTVVGMIMIAWMRIGIWLEHRL